MKKLNFFVALAAMLICGSNGNAEPIEPVSSVQSECKDGTHTRASNYKELNGTVSYRDGVLTLSVTNLTENCCADPQVTADADTPGEIHFAILDKAGALCDCICPFDIECTYEGILTGHYEVFLEYGPKDILLEKEIDIEEGCSVTLDKPAGVDSVSSAADSPLSMGRDHVLTVNMQGQTELEIFDAEGRLMSAMTIQAPVEVSLATLPAGLYILRATNADNSATLRTVR